MENQNMQQQEPKKQFTPFETSINILLDTAVLAQSKGILSLKQASQVNAAVEYLTTPQQHQENLPQDLPKENLPQDKSTGELPKEDLPKENLPKEDLPKED